MIHMMRKIKLSYTGDDKYLPEGIERKKWYPIVGYEARKIEKSFDSGKKWVEELFYFVISSQGKVTLIASFNCHTAIDEQAEIPGGQLIGLMNNILTLLKVWSEKHEKEERNREKDSGKNS